MSDQAKLSDQVAALVGGGRKAAFKRDAVALMGLGAIPDFPELGVKEFSTGAHGWYGNGKVVIVAGGVGYRCQVGINATVINSKGWNQAQIDAFKASVKPITLSADPNSGIGCEVKEFSSGSVGYFGGGKFTFQGYSVQLSVTITVVGSKEWAD